MSYYDPSTLESLADMNYKIKLEQIGVRARPSIETDLVINNDFTKEMLDDYGKLYNQPIERYNPISGEYEVAKYEMPVDDVDLETINLSDPNFMVDDDLIFEKQKKINYLYDSMIDMDKYNKWKSNNSFHIMIGKEKLARLKDKINILEENYGKLSPKKQKEKKLKHEKEINNINRQIRDITKEINDADNDIIEVDIENFLSGKYSVNKINDTILHEINKLENEIITDSDKSDAINAEKKRIATVNKQKIAKHQDMLNTLNSGFMKITQFQGESEEEYLKRLNDIAAQPYNENLYFNATIDNIEKLKKSFKDITKDNTVIEGVVNGLSTEFKYLVNKFWGVVKKKLLSLYGFDNRNVDSSDYLETIYKTLTEQENGAYPTQKLKPDTLSEIDANEFESEQKAQELEN